MKKIGLFTGIAAGITALVLCTLASYTILIQWLWVGFMSMVIYFATGADKSLIVARNMICSFVCGLIWGQLSNAVYHFVFPANHTLASVLDYFVLVALLVFVHLGLLNRTPFGFLPTVFLGLAGSIGFWGRPFPFAGAGTMGQMPILSGMVILFCYCVFGVVFALMIQFISAGLLAVAGRGKSGRETVPGAKE